MTLQIALLLGILLAAVILFLSEKLTPDLVAILVMLSLGAAQLITPQQAFSGLSSPSVILIIAVFIITGGLFRTGVSTLIGRWLVRAAGDREMRLVVLVMIAAAGLSLFMNNIASAAVIMPAVMDASRRTKISPSKVLLPMAMATQLGGMATLFTTASIVASGVLQNAGLPGFGLFDFLSTGGVAALVGIAYLALVGFRYLPDRHPMQELVEQQRTRVDLVKSYKLGERLQSARLKAGSPLIGITVPQTDIGRQLGVTVLAIERNGKTLAPSTHERLREKDVLLVVGREDRASQLGSLGALVEPAIQWTGNLASPDSRLTEVLVSPHAGIQGKTLKDIEFRAKYGLSVIALWRGDHVYRTSVGDQELRAGDALLVLGRPSQLELLRDDPNWILLRVDAGGEIRPQKMRAALLILVAALLLAAVGPWPVSLVLFVASLAMVLIGALSMDEAYRAIEWRSVFLVAGMLPVGIALSSTGAAALLGHTITGMLSGAGPLAVVAGLFAITAAINQFIPGGSAVPALLTPIAIAAATNLGADPRAFALVVAIATGTSMLTPFAHPVNVLVMGPGGYRFGDYLRTGLPLVILTLLTVLITLPIFWHV
ncbi:MAG: SLC13 family permease [Rudaea sp.]